MEYGNSGSKLCVQPARSDQHYVNFLAELRSGNYGRKTGFAGKRMDYGQIVFVDPEANRFDYQAQPGHAPEWYNVPFEGQAR